ncbi:MAG TPA: 50S ribosomal protein L25 [Candidatus Paceibacterota bacterium]|nr:50S ribosomal protein L25 [Candidatus Paceibacterota bacterium]
MFTLTAAKRDTSATLSAIRRAGSLPAIVYGPKQESTPITLPLRAFEKAFRDAGESSVIELSGVAAAPLQVLIHEVDLDPVTSIPRHADFYAIEKGAKVEVAVPLVFVGDAPAVKAGALVVKVLHELEIEAEAANLPHELTVDISTLVAFGDQIRAQDIKLPAGVTLKISPDEVIALAQEVKEEVVEVAPAADLSTIEVEKKGKEEEEGEAGAAAAPAPEAKK